MTFQKVLVRVHVEDLEKLKQATGETHANWAVQVVLNDHLQHPFELDALGNRRVSEELWQQAVVLAATGQWGARRKALAWLNEQLAAQGKAPVKMITLDKQIGERKARNAKL